MAMIFFDGDEWGQVVEVYITPWEVESIRKTFDVPSKISDEDLAEYVAQLVIDRYLSPSHLSEKDMEQIADGILHGGE